MSYFQNCAGKTDLLSAGKAGDTVTCCLAMVSKEWVAPHTLKEPQPTSRGNQSLIGGPQRQRKGDRPLSEGLTVCAVTTSLLAKKKKGAHTINNQ